MRVKCAFICQMFSSRGRSVSLPPYAKLSLTPIQFFFYSYFCYHINLAFLCFFQKLAVHLHHLYHHSFRPDSLSLASASEYFSYFIHLYDAFQVINKLLCNSCHKLVIEILCNISPITYFLLSRPFELRCSVYQFLHFGAYLLQQLL